MNKSNDLNELAAALSKLQGSVTDAHKDKSGFNYKYADLSSVLDIVRPLLSQNGLAITQLCSSDYQHHAGIDEPEGGTQPAVRLETMLMHTSGQWLSSSMRMIVQPMKGMTIAQSMGTVISYARRYMLASLLGLTQVDNDGSGEVVAAIPETIPDSNPIYKELIGLLDTVKIAPTEQARWLSRANVKHLNKLTNEQVVSLVEMLKKRLADKVAEDEAKLKADEELQRLKALGGIENAV